MTLAPGSRYAEKERCQSFSINFIPVHYAIQLYSRK